MKDFKKYAIIIAGGRGERFWPLSRFKKPKQFLKLFYNKSLLKLTKERISKIIPLKYQKYVIPKDLAKITRNLLKLKENNLIIEPQSKNTAIAIALASLYIKKEVEDALTIVLPADHLIKNFNEFHKCVNFAFQIAQEDYLLTFGIPPTYPATGYGYIEIDNLIKEENNLKSYLVKRFIEKPNYEKAKEFLESKRFLWNSGMFVWKVSYFLTQVERFMPSFYEDLKLLEKYLGTKKERKLLEDIYQRAENISVDYAIMEKAERIAVIKSNFDWDDVGSILALERYYDKDEGKNVKIGDIFTWDTENSIFYTKDLPIFSLGIKDLILIKDKDLIFACNKKEFDKIKNFLKILKENKRYQKYL
ncbi:MAG: mannose-1-phosphate guanylyltransferase [candidate division WOR-3 bacterium]|nr:mannose-1-phosphate guanylyltransferase [candidate division WOR-3 bacterium]MCX7837659.1 mannose-1-phosphate guanylyltransferase [candidate division WOR-3 bacterium]MDW8113377.1 mannose-1-phosphate guanylyltransferase [candidate division WOR-3 bacterium]